MAPELIGVAVRIRRYTAVGSTLGVRKEAEALLPSRRVKHSTLPLVSPAVLTVIWGTSRPARSFWKVITIGVPVAAELLELLERELLLDRLELLELLRLEDELELLEDELELAELLELEDREELELLELLDWLDRLELLELDRLLLLELLLDRLETLELDRLEELDDSLRLSLDELD